MKSNKLLGSLKVLIILLALCVMTGCGWAGSMGESSKVHTALLIGEQSNAPAYPTKSENLKSAIYESCYTCGKVSIIANSGKPKVVFSADIPEYEVKGLSQNKKKSISQGYMSQIVNEISDIGPSAEGEIDTLQAINLASMELSLSDESSGKNLIIMDSGLSTSGYLNFTDNILYADVNDVVDRLDEANAIPDLKGVNIVWLYIGQTALPQQELSEKQKDKLKDIWNAVLTQGGAKTVVFTTDIASDPAPEGYPRVSLVDVEDRSILVEINIPEPTPDEESDEDDEGPIEGPYPINESLLNFIGNKAEFIDENKAREALRECAQMLLDHPDNTVYVIGTTAEGDKDFCDQLSKDRAQKVTQVLIELGVPSKQLIPIGMGYSDPWHLYDLDDSGRQIEEIAKKNRKVLIVDTKSDLAKQLYQ